MRVRTFIELERDEKPVEVEVSGDVAVDGSVWDLDWTGDVTLCAQERWLAEDALVEATAGGDW